MRAQHQQARCSTSQRTTLLRTDRNGWIELITDGAQLWVEVENRSRD